MKPKHYEQGMVFVGADDLRIELTADETSIIHALTQPARYYEKVEIIRLLKIFCNADRVWKVIELRAAQGETIFVVDHIIINIGDRSPEDYVAFSGKISSAFTAMQWEYFRRFQAAKTEREKTAVVRWWSDYLDSLDIARHLSDEEYIAAVQYVLKEEA
jgi:hypothetical protein